MLEGNHLHTVPLIQIIMPLPFLDRFLKHLLLGALAYLAYVDDLRFYFAIVPKHQFNPLFKFHDYCFLNNVDVWHKTLDCVSGDDFETDIHVPLRHIVRKWTIKCFPEFSWSELLQICIHNENDKTCVEELTNEGTLNNRSFLLGNCIFANP